VAAREALLEFRYEPLTLEEVHVLMRETKRR
jgi:hypothetical protein